MKNKKSSLEIKAAAAALLLSLNANHANATPQQIPNGVNQKLNAGLQRSQNIKEMSPNGKTTTRHIYNWQEVIKQYYLEASDFSALAKLSKEQNLECAAILRAIARYEAENPSSIEDKYYHDNLIGKISDNQCTAKINEAKANVSKKSFTQIVHEERTLLENNKSERKKALEELDKFRNQNDLNKGIWLTDSVDKQIEQNNGAQSKTFNMALYLQSINKRV